MEGIAVIAIGIGGTILIIATLGIIVIGIIKTAKSGGGGISKKTRLQDSEETKLIQDLHHGMSRMEERVEALETILLEHRRKEFK